MSSVRRSTRQRQALRAHDRDPGAIGGDVPSHQRVAFDGRAEHLDAEVGEQPVRHLSEDEDEHDGLANERPLDHVSRLRKIPAKQLTLQAQPFVEATTRSKTSGSLLSAPTFARLTTDELRRARSVFARFTPTSPSLSRL